MLETIYFAQNLLEVARTAKSCSNVAEHNRERPTLLGRDPLCKLPLSLCILGGRLRDVPTVLTYDLFPSPSF